MKCPKCHKDVEMLKYTSIGTMCHECDCDSTAVIDSAFCSPPEIPPALDKIMAALALSIIPHPGSSPREALESYQPYFEECIVTPENGGCVALSIFEEETTGGGHILPAFTFTYRKMKGRYVRRLPKGTLNKLTPERVQQLRELAMATPLVEFYLQ